MPLANDLVKTILEEFEELEENLRNLWYPFCLGIYIVSFILLPEWESVSSLSLCSCGVLVS